MKQLEQRLDSREVAEMVGKEHKNIIRDIRGYLGEFSQLNLEPSDFFIESTYKNERGKEYPCYLVSKKGCEFIAHKLTGVKGTEFTAKYINRFHDMEETIKQTPLGIPQQIQVIAQGYLDIAEQVNEVKQDLEDFKNDLPLLAIECQKITWAKNHKVVPLLGGKESEAYRNKSLRTKVYRDVDKQLRREFGVNSYKAIKRSQCDTALEIIDNYELPLVLKDEIEAVNSQISFI